MMKKFENLLRDNHLKITPQRMAILKEIHTMGHATVDDIYEKIRVLYPSLSLATVYKNLASLQEVNIIDELCLPNQKQRYELVKDSHIHLVCDECGEIVDVDMPSHKLGSECVIDSGYKINEVNMVFIGVCPNCQKKQDS